MYQALYRKYRPQRFSDVVGQEHITNTLRRQVETGRTGHAYLFVGSRGTGKTTCAKILARAVNCEHPINGEPCNECAACTGIMSGGVLDVAEIDAASNNGVDNVRAIRDEAIFLPTSVKKRVYIIDEVHMLSTPAFNALLKILEEPPEHLVFILATTELNKVPATILSRCQRFSFKRLAPEEIEGRIKFVAKEEKIDITDGAVSLLARLGDGAMRDALSLLDRCLNGATVDENAVLAAVGLAGSADTARLWGAIASGDAGKAMAIFDSLYMSGADPSSVLNELVSLMRDMMLVRIAPKGSAALISGAFGRDALNSMSAGLDTAALLKASETLQEAVGRMNTVKDRRIAAELAIIKLAAVFSGTFTEEVPMTLRQPAVEQEKPLHSAPAKQAEKAPAAPPWEDIPPTAEPAPMNDALPPWEDEPPEQFVPWKTEEPPAEEPLKAEQTAQKATEPSVDFWDEVLKRAAKTLDAGKYRILSDRMNTSGREESGGVVIAVTNDFQRMMLDTPDVKSAVASAASAVLGRNVIARVQVEDKQTQMREDKLSELSRFGNIKFT